LAESYGSIIYEVFLKIEKPYIIQGNGDYIWKVIDGSSSPDTFFDENVPLNYNGIIFQKVIDFNGRLGSKYVLDISDVYMVRNSNQIKLADGTNTTFDAENPDIRYADGGAAGEEITCINCGWHWNTSDSDESDKYVCHKCGFDNKAFYDPEPIGFMADGGTAGIFKKKIFYHGSNTLFTNIKFLESIYREDLYLGDGIYITNDINVAKKYGKYIYEIIIEEPLKSLNYSSAVSREDMIEIIDIFQNSDDADLNYLATDYQDDLDYDDLLWGKQLIADLERNGVNVHKTLLDLGYNSIISPINKLNDFFGFDDNSMNINVIKKGILHIYSIQYEDGILQNPLDTGMRKWEKKEGIVLRDKENQITLIAYNTENRETGAELYNKALIYKSVKPIRQANDIIEMLDNQLYEQFDESKIEDYKKSNRLIIMNQNEVVYDSEKPDLTYADGGLIAPNGKSSNLTEEQYRLVRTPEFKAWFGDWENDPQNASKVVDKNGEPLVVYHGSRSYVDFAFSEFNVPSEGVFFTSDFGTANWFSSGNYPKYHFEKIIIPKNLSEDSSLKDLEKFFKKELDPTSFVELVNVTDGSTYYRLYEDYERESSPLGSNIKDAQKKLYKIINYKIEYINNRKIRPLYQVFLNIKKPYIINAKGKSFYETPFEGKEYAVATITSAIKDRGENDGVIILNTIEGTDYNYQKIANTYNVFYPNQIKLSDGSNTTFDASSPDIRYAKGGQFNRESGLKKLAKEKKATITNAFDQLKKSMLADQYKIVRTSEFKNWFGDWQKDPNNCSVIREKNGEPMVVWHGSPSKFNIFKNVENGVFYFAENAGYASHFADDTKNTYPYFLNIRKIFDATKFDIKENEVNIFIKEFGISTKWLKKQEKLNKHIKFWELLRHDEDFRKYLIKQGYDGIRYVEDNDDGWIEKSVAYGCFNANQIKLANGVNTTFSTKSKDIRYADGGLIYKKIYSKGGGGYTTVINGMEYSINKQYTKGTWVAQSADGEYYDEAKTLADIKYYLEKLKKDLDNSYADGGAVQVPSTEDLIQLVVKERENKIREWYRMRYKVVVARNDGYSYKKESERDSEFIDSKNPSRKKVLDIINSNPDLEEIRFNGTIKVGNRVGEGLEIVDDFSVLLWKKDNSYADGGGVGDFKRITTEYLGIDESFEDTEYRYKDASIRYSKLDKLWILDMQQDGKPQKTIGGYKTLKAAKEVAIYYLKNPKMYADGGLSKTPAPKKDRVFGSDKNKVGSAASKESAKKINLSDGIITTLSNKAKEYNEDNSGNKVSLNTLKAVMRRGMGAYSTSHRPTITGGAPNSRQAWGFARVNKFLKKKSGEKVKKAYIQDDDLLADGGLTHKNNLKMTQHNYQSMKPIGEIQVGDVYLIKEDMFAPHQDHEHPQHLSTRYATVEVKSPCHKSLDAYVLEVMDCDCDHAAGKYEKGKIIERSRKHILSSGKLKSAVAKNEPTEKIGLDDIYMGDSINYDGKTYEVGGLSDCRTKVKIKFDDNESNVDIDDVMDRAILIKRGN